MITYKNLSIHPVLVGDIRKAAIVQLGGLTMGEWCARQVDKPKYLLNASLWDGDGAIGTIWRGGKLIRNEGGGYGFGLTGTGWAFGQPWEWPWVDYITGTPAIIRDGAATGARMPIRADEVASTRRSVLAAAGQHLYLVTGQGLTLAETTRQLLDYGVYTAINLDGGGSSRLLVNGVPVNAPTDNRRCPNAIAIWMKTEEKPKEENKLKSIYLSPSTQEKNIGAGSYGTEERRMNQLADLLENELRGKYILYRNRPEWSLQQVVADSNQKRPDIHLALHSNAGGARGCEVMICGKGGQAEKLAQAIYKEMEPLTPTSDRGVKVDAKLYEPRETKAPAALVEVEFHDSSAGAAWIVDNLGAIAKAIAKGVNTFFGVTTPEEAPSQQPSASAAQAWAKAKAKGVLDGTMPQSGLTREQFAVALDRLKLLD